MWEKVSTAIKTIMQNNSLIENVYTFEASQFSGSPIATITPSANESDYHTTTENRRIYAFMVRLYIERGSTANDEQIAEEAMRQLVDSVIDDFDNDYQLASLVSQTGYTFLFLDATPSQWGYVGAENNYRIAEINIQANFHIDTTLIS